MFFIDKMLKFVLFVPSVVWFTIHMLTGHLEDRDHALIFLLLLCTTKLFLYFFPNTLIVNFQQEIIAFLCKKIQRHFLRGVLL